MNSHAFLKYNGNLVAVEVGIHQKLNENEVNVAGSTASHLKSELFLVLLMIF